MNFDGIFQLKNKIIFSADYIILIFILIYSILLSLGPAVGGDVYFYLESGKNFIENGISLTPIDNYIFTRKNLTIELSPQWASMYALYVFYMLGGWPLLYVIKSILVTAVIYSPFLLSSRLNINSPLIPVFSVIAIYASSFRFDFRTDLVSLLLIVYLLLFVIILRTNKYKLGKWCFLVPFVFAVWVNLHPGFYIGLLVVGLSFVVDMYSYMRGENSKFKSNYISALAVFICSIFCCLLNPNGLKGFLYPMFLTVSNKAATIREYIPEWQSCLHNLDKPHVRIFLLLSVIYSVALFCHAYNKLIKKTIDIDDIYVIIISIFFILIGFLGVRYIAITSFCITVNFVYIIANNERSIILTKIYKLRYLITLTLIVFISLSVNDIVDRMSKINAVTNNYHAFLSPNELANHIDKHNIDTSRMYLHYRYGAYLAWKWHGNKKVFIHSFVQDPDLFREYINAQITDDGLNYVINKYDINTIVLPPDVLKKFPIGDILKNDRKWKVIYKDFQCVMYSKVEA